MGDDDFKGLSEKDGGVFVSEVVKDEIGDEGMSCVLLRGFGEFGSRP